MFLGWASIKRHHGELWHIVDDAEWTCSSARQQINDNNRQLAPNNHLNVAERNRYRTASQSSSHSVTFANENREDFNNTSSLVTSTPRRPNFSSVQPSTCWETDSQSYSLEGSSVHLDSDSDHSTALSTDADRTSRRAYTLPPLTQAPGQDFVGHIRSFSDSQYPPGDDSALNRTASTSGQPTREMRFLARLRTSLRLRKSKRFSLSLRKNKEIFSSMPPSSPIQLVHTNQAEPSATSPALSATAEEFHFSSATEEASSDDEDGAQEETQSPPPAHYSYQLNRIGSILSRLKSVPYKRRPVGRSGYFIGLCLPVQLSNLHPPKAWFERSPDQEESTSAVNSLTVPLNEETLFHHDIKHCVLCSFDPPSMSKESNLGTCRLSFYHPQWQAYFPVEQTEEEKLLVRKELLRLVTNMGSSVGLNANEQGLLRYSYQTFNNLVLLANFGECLID